MPIVLGDVVAPTSGQFFRLSGPLTNAEVTQIFTDALPNVGYHTEANEVRTPLAVGNTNYWASLLCFPVDNPPAFAPQSGLAERRYAFLLLIEIQQAGSWFLGVFKNGMVDFPDSLEALCVPISRRALLHAFSKNAKFEKLSSKRMTVSQSELRGSSYEASDLAVTLPSLAITRSVPRVLRLQNKAHGSISITVSTSRIHKAGARRSVANLARLVSRVARETARPAANEFLDAFPTGVDFNGKPKGLRPAGVLFDWWPLLQNPSVELKWIRKNRNVVHIQPKRFLNAVGGVLITKRHSGEWVLRNEDSVDIGRLRETKSGYTVTELLQQKVTVADTDTNEEQPLTTWIRKQKAFQVAFSSPEYFFSAGSLYRRPRFERDIQLIRSILKPAPVLAGVDSEKGKPPPKAAAVTEFPPGSIFRFVEDVHCFPREYLWCCDLGVEWADYITVHGERIIFAHCKHGSPTLGATSYQEVIGQALKNLGRLQALPEAFAAKVKAAANTATWGNTGIVRLRDGKPWADFEAAIDQRVRNPNITREVHLIISMLSEAQFNAAAAAKNKRPNFIQLVWLLASFLNSTRELGGKPVIVCRP